MIDQATYRRYRAKGYQASQAFLIAKIRESGPDTFQWSDLSNDFWRDDDRFMGGELETADGLTVTVGLVRDHEGYRPGDTCGDGTWTYHEDRFGSDRDDRDNGEHLPFVHRVDDQSGYWLVDMTAELREMVDYYRTCGGRSRSVCLKDASASIAQRVAYVASLLTGDRATFGIVATVTRNGMELASDSVWGFDYDPWNPDERRDLVDQVNEIAGESLYAARETSRRFSPCG